jgi:nucleotide-binding universal stress UspA family protein
LIPAKKILAAVNASAASDEALRQAHFRATETGAELVVCHVTPDVLGIHPLFPQLAIPEALLTPFLQQRVSEVVTERVMSVTGRTEKDFVVMVLGGPPHVGIVHAADECGADLVVVGARSRRTSRRALLGSIAERVVRHAHCSVLIARPVESPAAPIVVGTDLSDPALPAISAATAESRSTGSPLVVVHAIDFPNAVIDASGAAFGAIVVESPENRRKLELLADERMRESLEAHGFEGERRVEFGPAVEVILGAVADTAARLVVVGTLGRTGLRRALLGSVAEAVVRSARCSVLVVRRNPDEGLAFHRAS